jgi:hypothetical protein
MFNEVRVVHSTAQKRARNESQSGHMMAPGVGAILMEFGAVRHRSVSGWCSVRRSTSPDDWFAGRRVDLSVRWDCR